MSRRITLLQRADHTMASSGIEIPDLNLGHPIFISHSGKNKTFAKFLHGELTKRWLHPFLDERSLPKGTEVNMDKILKEARSSKLALLVLTPDFFTATRNPMLEVMACVDSNVRMLPLFYKLTVKEVKDNKDLYRQKWTELNVEACNIDAWNGAYEKIISYNGAEYGKKSTNDVDFINEVADMVLDILPPDKQRDDTYIVGKYRLVKAVEELLEGSPDLEQGIKVLGLHGIEGTGKTCLCQALCNFYLSNFKGRVCHLQLHEGSPRDRIDSILLQLDSRNDGYKQRTDIEAQKQLESTLSASKFFLVIDDIQGSCVSDKDEVGSLILRRLKAIRSGSKVLVLARDPGTLRNVFSAIPEGSNIHIHPFPSLSLDEAKLILCREIPSLLPEDLIDQQQSYFLNQCAELCTPTSGSNIYNPLMLKLLASFLVEKWAFVKGSGKGMSNLEGFRRHLSSLKGARSRGMKEFFDKLQTRFNTLMEEDQDLFLDLALFAPREDVVSKQVCLRRDKKVVKDILEKLQHAAFLSDDYGILDVYKELAKMIVRESPKRFYGERRYLKGADLLQLVKKTWTRVAFVDCTFRMPDLDLSGCAEIQVLLLDGNEGLRSVITPSLNTLQSIEIRPIMPMLVEDGKFLSSHNCSSDFKFLAILELGGGGTEASRWSLDVSTLSHCEVLEIVHFYNIKLRMSLCMLPCWAYLRELKLSRLFNLKVLGGLEQLSILKKLCLSQLEALTSLSDVQSLDKLIAFVLGECNSVSELRLPSSLQHCTIEKCNALRKIDFGGGDAAVVMDTSEVTEAERSDDERVASDSEIKIKDCRNLEEISGLQKEGQLVSSQGFDFRCLNWGKSGKMLYIEIRKSAHSWYLHGLALDEVRRCRFERKLLNNGLKSLKVVCGKSGYCGCKAKCPRFHLFHGLESLEYHCSYVTDLFPIRQCTNLRILNLNVRRDVAENYQLAEMNNFEDQPALDGRVDHHTQDVSTGTTKQRSEVERARRRVAKNRKRKFACVSTGMRIRMVFRRKKSRGGR